MINNKHNSADTIFVDCFNTIIYRNKKRKAVFKEWAQELSTRFNIPWKKIYRTYMNTNFNMCFKKLLTTFTLQVDFSIVLKIMFSKLVKKYAWLESAEFIDTATDIYIEKEKQCFNINHELVNFLVAEKNNGKKIYLVSDFYCKSEIFKEWFKYFEIENVFEKIFSSSDFDKEKATTKLYRKLLELLHLNPKNVIMYGDNLWSDIMMAKACGLQAKRIKKQHTKEKLCKKQTNQ